MKSVINPFTIFLQAARERSGLGRREIATRAGITPDLLSQYGRGRAIPPAAVLSRLCQVLGADPGAALAAAAQSRPVSTPTTPSTDG